MKQVTAATAARQGGILDEQDYELSEFAELADTQYQDSLVTAGLQDAEDLDQTKHICTGQFLHRLLDEVRDSGDDSVSARAVESALLDAEPFGRSDRFKVFFGPLARRWLRLRRRLLVASFGKDYLRFARNRGTCLCTVRK